MSRFNELIDEVRDFATMLAKDTYVDLKSQRCVPTFFLAAASNLMPVCEKGGLQLTEQLDFRCVCTLFANLNMLWFSAYFANRLPFADFEMNSRGIGLSYHLSDLEIANWMEATADSLAKPDSRLVEIIAYFDVVVGSVAKIWGSNTSSRRQNWLIILGDVNSSYHALMNNPAWISDIDRVLAGKRP